MNSLITNKADVQKEIEDKLLFLVQLWFDTFMLHEDDFKDIIAVYKECRKDGVLFPQRSASNQFLIKFDGKKSPIFEGIEHDRIYEEPSKTLNPLRNFEVKPADLFAQPPSKHRKSPPEITTAPKKPEEPKPVEADGTLSLRDLKEAAEMSVVMRGILDNASAASDLKGYLIRRSGS